MNCYDTPADYLDTATNLKDKISKLDILIMGLYDTMTKAVASGEIQEYHIDDGQSRIRTIYRSVPDLEKGILGFERMRALYVNKLRGRCVNLKDHNSIC